MQLYCDQNASCHGTMWFLLWKEKKEEYDFDIQRCSVVGCIFQRLLFSFLERFWNSCAIAFLTP